MNKQIVIGGSGVLLLVTMVLLFPLFTNSSPSKVRPWAANCAPLSSIPSVESVNEFKVGQKLKNSLLSQYSQLTIAASSTNSPEYRVKLDKKRGRVVSITKVNGAYTMDRLSLDEGAVCKLVQRYSNHTIQVTDNTMLAIGQQLPANFSKVISSRVFFLTSAYQNENSRVVLNLKNGIVQSISVNGTDTSSFSIRGEAVLSVTAGNGEAIETFFLLGTDMLGRDLFVRLVYGTMISLLIAVVATLVSLIIGVLYGAFAAYLGGRTDRFMMGAVDVLYAMPFMFLVIILLVNFGRNLIVLFIALGAVQWLTMSRIVRSSVLTLKEQEFVQAARVSGASHFQIILEHILPNLIGVVIVYMSLTVPAVIMEESFLSFIGLSVLFNGQALDSLGALVSQGMQAVGEGGERAWLLWAPSLVMVYLLMSLNLLGDGLRDWLDPRLKNK